ncbi:hypothetical protein YC2023_085342 [Brassica napus]
MDLFFLTGNSCGMFVVTGVGSSLAVLLATTSQFPGKGLGYVFRRNPLHCLCVGLDHNDNEESERIISSFDETKESSSDPSDRKKIKKPLGYIKINSKPQTKRT